VPRWGPAATAGDARASGARMEFKLNLEPHGQQHRTVETDAMLDRMRAMSAARGGLARVRAASAGAGGALQKAKFRAAEAGRNNIARVRRFEEKWNGWLKTQNTNYWLLISNVLYISVTLVALILSLLVMNEHVGDFRRNEYTLHERGSDGKPIAYKPCGMPTPDSMYLLQAIGALPAAGFDGASLEPDYKNWMQSVDRALCARLIPGQESPVYYEDISQCENEGLYSDYGHEHTEELLAFGYLMDDETVTPTVEDIEGDTVSVKFDLFEERACLESRVASTLTTPAKEVLYSKQQRQSYGDLKTRVGRAYIAAMPAFARYQKEREGCQAAVGFKDPFDDLCKHSCHLRKELKAAAADQHIMYDTAQGGLPEGTTFTKQLYRLMALSLAGYYDRYFNEGMCFRNSVQPNGERLDAIQFCGEAMAPNPVGDDESSTNKEAVTEYSVQNTKVSNSEQCGSADHLPPPPAPPMHRNDANVANDKLSSQVCAATLQYGLFEQGRLFGVPDILSPFVVDTRADRGLHFLAKWIYNAMYVNPMKKAGDILSDPKSKLEMYIAYRLSSTSIWCILVANVAGYMLVRSLAPFGVYILKMAGVKTNVPKTSIPGMEPEFEPIVLVRPQLGWPLYLAQITNLLLIYWIFFIDPAVQSHYYITTECDDWAGLGVHVPSGAYVTNWGKRRYARFGEHVIGILLVFTFLFVVFQQIIGRSMVSPAVRKAGTTVTLGSTSRLDKVALIMIAFALIIQILFITQSIVSGDDWYEAIKASDNDNATLFTFSKDALMSVWAAFWTSASIAWYRQKWAVDKLPMPFQLGWIAGSLLLLWMPVFHSAAYLSDEIDVAFTNGKGTEDTPRLIIYIFIYAFSGFWTGLLAIRLKAVWDAIPKRVGRKVGNVNNIQAEKFKIRQLIKRAKSAAAEQQDLNKYDWIAQTGSSAATFNVQGMTVPTATVPMQPGRKEDAVYMPLLPR
jgi:hypothetical protein